MTTQVASNEIQTIQEFKQQNDHYWKIIEKQRLIIQTLQKTVTNLSNENEFLVKRNKELESSMTKPQAIYPTPGFDSSAHVTYHPLTAEISVETNNNNNSAAAPAATTITPIPPPRSPYRVNHHNQQHEKGLLEMPKRPPVLKLATSNHSPLYSRGINAVTMVDRDYLISPGQRNTGCASNPSSPLSATSAGSSTLDNRPSFELYSDYSSRTSTPRRSSMSPNHQHEEDNGSTKRKSAESNNKKHLDILEHKAGKLEPATPVPRTPRFDSLMTRDDTTVLSNLAKIQVNVISSSIGTDEKGRDVPVFTIGIQQKDTLNEIWRIEKSLTDIVHLDTNLKDGLVTLKKLPEKSIFVSHAPAKVDERKSMIEEYLQHAISQRDINSPALLEFLSSDRVHNLPITLTNDVGVKQGYLTKRGKNFGGWKSRYFVLDHSGLLQYYENKDGHHLGTIKLLNSRIGCQKTNEGQDSNYRHAFLILEPKSNGHINRHIFCADSDEERDLWVDALRHYSNQLHSNEDNMHDDMAIDHNSMIQPSSSTESTSSRKFVKRASMDFIYNYVTKNNNTSGSRRKSLTAMNPTEEHKKDDQEEENKKLKHRNSKKTFWAKKKVFGKQHHAAAGSEILSPTSPSHGIAVGSPRDFSFAHDYEETRGVNQVFGIPLENAVRVARVSDQYELPAIVHRCIEYMETKGALVEEGIYRLSGSAALIKSLKKRFNEEGDVKLLEDKEYHDVHAIAGLLKMWLRELPESILTEALLAEFLQSIVDLEDHHSKKFEIGRLVSFLPLVNYTLLRSLCAHLIRVIENSDKNKMTLRNISIVFSATLGIPSSIFNLLLVEFDYIFWTDRCTHDEQDESMTHTATEDAINCYLQEEKEEEEEGQTPLQHPLVKSLRVREDSVGSVTRSRRNSLYYQDNTPKDFISLEKQLKAVIADIGSPYDDEPYYSDGELEVAYFASRYTANSKNPVHPLEEMRSVI